MKILELIDDVTKAAASICKGFMNSSPLKSLYRRHHEVTSSIMSIEYEADSAQELASAFPICTCASSCPSAICPNTSCSSRWLRGTRRKPPLPRSLFPRGSSRTRRSARPRWGHRSWGFRWQIGARACPREQSCLPSGSLQAEASASPGPRGQGRAEDVLVTGRRKKVLR